MVNTLTIRMEQPETFPQNPRVRLTKSAGHLNHPPPTAETVRKKFLARLPGPPQ